MLKTFMEFIRKFMLMRIKVRNSKTYYLIFFLVILIFFADLQFFYALKIGTLNTPSNKYLILFITIVADLILAKYIQFNFNKFKFFSFFLLYICVVVLMISIKSMIIYKESFIDVFTCFHHFFIVLLTIPMFFLFERSNGFDKVFSIINSIVCISCLILLLQSIFYKQGFLLPGLNIEEIQIRNGNIRIFAGNLTSMSFMYNLSILFNVNSKKKKKKTIISCIIQSFTIITVQMSRFIIVLYVFLICCGYIIAYKKNKMKIILFFIIFIIGISVLDFESFTNSFSINSSTGISTSNRIEAMNYFINQFVEHPISGIGFIRDSRFDLAQILHGATLTYYYSDVGLIGLMGEMGLLGISIYFVFLFRIIWIYIKIKKSNVDKEKYIFLSLLLIYVISSSFTAILTNPANTILFAIVFACFEYVFFSQYKRRLS